MPSTFSELYNPDQHFGEGWIAGEDNFFPAFTPEERVLLLGMLDACPEPSAMIAAFGHEWIIHRYTECNLVAGFILEKAKELKPRLAVRMTYKKPRRSGEKPDNYEQKAIPSDYLKTLYPGSSAVGYASSRILIEQFGREKPWEVNDERVKNGHRILEETLTESQSSSPVEFLVLLARNVSVPNGEADPTKVLGHLLAVELQNEGVTSQVAEIARLLRKFAPDLWTHYHSLSAEEKKAAGTLPRITFPG